LKNASLSEFAAVSDPVRKIVVAGGGTAGWMVASLLGRHFERQPVAITVVESSEIGTVGVGEATVPAIREYFQEIGIDAYEVMRATQGTIKLGIEFDGWARPGQEGVPLGEPFFLRFTTGRREKFWEKNCIAAGLAAGFMEPLESTSITLIQTAAERLVSLFPDRGCSGALADEFNRQTALEYERIRDFLVLHYLANRRHGGLFWDECRQRGAAEHLARKIRMFRDSGRLINYEWETFLHPSWLSMYAGFDMQPDRYDRRADFYTLDELRAGFAQMRVDIEKSVSTAMPHADFIAQHCAAAN
jgi:hypothetical protein